MVADLCLPSQPCRSGTVVSGTVAVLEIFCFMKFSFPQLQLHPLISVHYMSLSYNEDDEDLRAAMEADSSPPPESPIPEPHNATKRFHSSLSDDDDSATNNGRAPSSQFDSPDPSQPLAVSINRNIGHHAKQYANRKKLKTEQLAEVDVFLTVRSFHTALLGLIVVALGHS